MAIAGATKDAVCGVPLCGQAVAGVWVALPAEAGVALGGQQVAITIASGSDSIVSVTAATLHLGASPATASISGSVTVTMPGLVLGSVAVTSTTTSAVAVSGAGLLLGALAAVFVGEVWLWPEVCEELDLAEAPSIDFDLAEAASTSFVLQPLNCR